MRPNQERILKNIAKILGLLLAIYLVFWHPLFVLLTIISLVLLVILLIVYLPRIKEFFEDNDLFK